MKGTEEAVLVLCDGDEEYAGLLSEFMQALYNNQRELARLLKGLDTKDKELTSELSSLKDRLDNSEHKLDLLYKGHNPQQVISYKSFTPKDIYELKQTMH